MSEKVIGILGGMGPSATVALYNEIIMRTPATKDQEHLRILIDNNPKIPDRTAAIISDGTDPLAEMSKSAQALERAGADFIIMPCMSAHFFLERLRGETKLPMLSALDEMAVMIAEKHSDVKTVGLIATSGSVQGGLYQKTLSKRGIETLVPSNDVQENIMTAIYSIKGDPDNQRLSENKKNLIKCAGHLIDNGAQAVIAGCTEIPLALAQEDISVPLFNPMIALAEAAVRTAKNGQ